MVEIVGIRFRDCGQIHFFKSGKYNLKKGDHCWAETPRGSVLGTVVMPTTKAFPSIIPENMSRILAVAENAESAQKEDDAEKESSAFIKCQELILKHELGMKLVKCSFINDGKKVIFFFTAEGRVDFRELLKDLAREFKIRIELRQIGVRDESKILGGIGSCGFTLCCATWIDEFKPVSIKMAKQQNLSLDPQKISGVCGRLKCCLSYEFDDEWDECRRRHGADMNKKSLSGCFNAKTRPKPYDPQL